MKITTSEQSLIENFVYGELLEQDFLSMYPVDLIANKGYFINLLHDAIGQKDHEHLEVLLDVSAVLEMYKNVDFQPIYRNLLREDWHQLHESLVDSLDKTPPNEDSFLSVLNKTLDYHADAVEDFMVPIWSKCLWSLFKIGSENGGTIIRQYVHSEFEYLRDTARILMNKLEESEQQLRTFIQQIAVLDSNLTRTEVSQQARKIDLNHPEWQKLVQEQKDAFYAKHESSIQEVTRQLIVFFPQSTTYQRIQLWKVLSETKILGNVLHIEHVDEDSEETIKKRLLLHIVSDLGNDTRDALMGLNQLQKEAENQQIDFKTIIAGCIHLANTDNKHGMGSMKTILQRLL